MKIKIIEDINELTSLKDQWNDLLENSPVNIVSLTHDWVISWCKSFCNSSELHLVTVYHNGDLIAIAPLMKTKYRYHGFPYKKICFLANGLSPSVDFIMRKDKITDCNKTILDYLMSFVDWDLIELQKLYENGYTFKFITEYLRQSNFPFGFKHDIETPFIVLDSEWEHFLKKRSSKFKKVLRNKLNRIENLGDISYEKITIKDGNDQSLNDMFSISGKSWKNKVGTDLISDNQSKIFYMDICDRVGPLGMIDLWFLKKNSNPIAFEFHLCYNNVIYPLRADYDESFDHLSPGSILEYYILKTMFTEAKIKEYNTCGHTYDYLLRWSKQTRRHSKVEIFNRKFYPHFLHFLKYRMPHHFKGLRKRKKFYLRKK